MEERIQTLEADIVAHARQNEAARRLATMPGIVPIAGFIIAASVTHFGVFKRARDFATFLGLVRRQHSTGGKTRLGKIIKTGSREIRKFLYLGATNMVNQAPESKTAVGGWNCGLLLRQLSTTLVTVALANKMARIAPPLLSAAKSTTQKGGVATAWMLYEMAARNMFPAALALNGINPIMVRGVALAESPLMSGFDCNMTSATPNAAMAAMDPAVAQTYLRALSGGRI